MARKITGKLLILAWLFSSTASLARPIPSEEIASLINQRLSYMKDVAGYKADHHLAIED
ncbi:MAG: chorismate mutase, partial [Hafnia sp.]